ncbi:MAG: hypothetical protein IKN17_09000 [Ruminococcus sp.]|nr:hypothetical protein [Ruminococcus sp.]
MIPGEKKLADIIARHNSVCWYPSAGGDLRALLYLSKQFFEITEELREFKGNLPDLFIFTDYHPGAYEDYSNHKCNKQLQKMNGGTLRAGDVLFEDERTNMTAESVGYFDLEGVDPYGDAIRERPDPAYGRCCCVKLSIKSRTWKNLGYPEVCTVHLVYAFVENTSFARNFLLKNSISTEWIVKIRYGIGFGGSRDTAGSWIFLLAKRLGAKYVIVDSETRLQIKDAEILENYFGLKPDEQKLPTGEDFYIREWYPGWQSYWTEVVLPENNNTEELK